MAVSESSERTYALDPDVRLMLQVRDGSAAAFEQLVARYQDRLLLVLEHLVGNRELAEDLAQEVFLRVFRARRRYRPTAKFATWLFTIANNIALNAKRDRSRRREVRFFGAGSGSLAAVAPLSAASADSALMPTRQLAKAEVREIVRLAVEQLGRRQRLAVLLNKFEGMDYEEIGQVMGLSSKAVKSLVCRARTRLREALEPYLLDGTLPEPSAAKPSGEAPGETRCGEL